MNAEERETKRSSQFGILDGMLLTAACAYSLVLVPVAHAGTADPFLTIGIMMGLTVAGSCISYPIWRFFFPRRFTVLAVNHAGYALTVIVLGIAWDAEIFRIFALVARGPMSFFGQTHFVLSVYPLVSDVLAWLFIIVALVSPIVLLMLAHMFRPNLVSLLLTSLGTALWYLTGIMGGLAGMD